MFSRTDKAVRHLKGDSLPARPLKNDDNVLSRVRHKKYAEMGRRDGRKFAQRSITRPVHLRTHVHGTRWTNVSQRGIGLLGGISVLRMLVLTPPVPPPCTSCFRVAWILELLVAFDDVRFV